MALGPTRLRTREALVCHIRTVSMLEVLPTLMILTKQSRSQKLLCLVVVELMERRLLVDNCRLDESTIRRAAPSRLAALLGYLWMYSRWAELMVNNIDAPTPHSIHANIPDREKGIQVQHSTTIAVVWTAGPTTTTTPPRLK